MNEIDRIALALHEYELGGACEAEGDERLKHIDAYRRQAMIAVIAVDSIRRSPRSATLSRARQMARGARNWAELDAALEEARSAARREADRLLRRH